MNKIKAYKQKQTDKETNEVEKPSTIWPPAPQEVEITLSTQKTRNKSRLVRVYVAKLFWIVSLLLLFIGIIVAWYFRDGLAAASHGVIAYSRFLGLLWDFSSIWVVPLVIIGCAIYPWKCRDKQDKSQ